MPHFRNPLNYATYLKSDKALVISFLEKIIVVKIELYYNSWFVRHSETDA